MSNVKLPQLDTTPLEKDLQQNIFPSAIAKDLAPNCPRNYYAVNVNSSQLSSALTNGGSGGEGEAKGSEGEEVMNNVFDPDMVERMIFPNLTVVSVDDYDELLHIYNETRQHIRKLLERIAHLEAELATKDAQIAGMRRGEEFYAYTAGGISDVRLEGMIDETRWWKVPGDEVYEVVRELRDLRVKLFDYVYALERINELKAKNAALRESLANQNSKEERLLAVAERIAGDDSY